MMESMNITFAKYHAEDGENVSINIEIDNVQPGLSVPLVAGNRHYDEIQRQVAAGTLTIQDAD